MLRSYYIGGKMEPMKYLLITYDAQNGIRCEYYDNYPGEIVSNLNQVDVRSNLDQSEGMVAWVLYEQCDGSKFYRLVDSDCINREFEKMIDTYVDRKINKY